MARALARIALALVVLYGVLLAATYAAMRQPPDAFGRVMKHVPGPLMMALPFETFWTSARAGTVDAGEPAPDFELPTLDHSARVRLSSFRGSRPVVLVFGSYT
jgi:hypothetical protein